MLSYENQFYSLKLNERSLISFSQNGVELTSEHKLPLFSIRLLDQDGNAQLIDANTAETAQIDGNVIHYSGFQEKDLTITVTIEASEGSPQVQFGIALENHSDLVIEYIDFPQILVPNNLTGAGGDYKLLWPFNEGVIIENLEYRERSPFSYIEPSYPSRGTSGFYPGIVEGQLMAYYNGTNGLYLAAHDNTGTLKVCEYFRYDSDIKLHFRAYTGSDFGCDYTMPYKMVLAAFSGEWQDAADIYRDWFEENHASDLIKISENKVLPEWYADSPIIVTYPVRGRHDTDVMSPNALFPYKNAMPHIDHYSNATDSRIMALLMHWEGTAPWAPPYVWPPYGGAESLREFADLLHEKNHLLGVYCSGLGYTDHSGLTFYMRGGLYAHEGLERYMCASPKGNVEMSHICRGIRYGYDICPATEYAHQTLGKEVEGMASGDIDYVQILDQNHGGLSTMCYSRNHGHAPVPGKWQVDEVKALLSEFADKAKEQGKNMLFGCESAAGEAFIPQLLFSDNRYNLNFVIGRPVPLYAYLYHSYVNNFMGNQVCATMAFDHEQDPLNLNFRIAYSFTAGDMLTAVINPEGKIMFNWGMQRSDKLLPDQENILTLLRNTNRWRRSDFKKYLLEGQMLKPIPICECSTITFRLVNGRDYTTEKILTSRWQANDQSIAQIFTNFDETEQTCTVQLGDKSAKLYTSPIAEPIHLTGTARITIPPLSAVMLTE